MKNLILLLFLSYAIAQPFCSAYCGASLCNDQTYLGCTGCDSPYSLNLTHPSSTCQLDASTNWISIAQPLTTPVSITPSTTTTCGTTNFYGLQPKTTFFTGLITGGTSIPHWQLTLIYWVVVSGNLATEQMISAVDSVNKYTNLVHNSTNINPSWCSGGGDQQSYMKISQTYSHTTLNATINIKIKLNNAGSLTYGIKDVIVLIRKCNDRCRDCFGDAVSQCYACTISGTYQSFFFNNTCFERANCPTSYYAQTSNHVCEQCSSNCNGCNNTSTNCTSCTSTKIYYNNTCVANCPNGTYNFSGSCILCDQLCLTCVSNGSSCTSCPTSGTYEGFLNGNTCVSSSSCPVGTYAYTSTHICTVCDSKCSACSGSATTCSACKTSGANQAFLTGSSCVISTACPSGSYAQVSNHTCTVCSNKCSVCTATSTNCSSCTTSGPNQSFLNGLSCVSSSSCPVGKYADTSTHICTVCDSKCSACSGSATTCSACKTSGANQAFLTGSSCVISTACPSGSYAQVSNHTCTVCSNKCSVCTATSTNCSSCTTSGPNQSFLNGLSCVSSSSCPVGKYADTSTHICTVCDSKCSACSGSATTCSACKTSGANQAFLTGSSCVISTACPSGSYAQVSNHTCTVCSNKCSVCTATSTNCSSCTTSGPNQSFLNGLSCVSSSSCPVGKYADTSTHICTSCLSICKTCINVNSFCTSCYTTNNTILYNNSCYSTCPNGTYLTSNGTQCTVCNSKCLLCFGTSTNCSACQTTGPNQSYYQNNQCVTNCSAGFFQSNATHTCSQCPSSCSSCIDPVTCTGCVQPYYQLGQDCLLTCPAGLYPVNGTYPNGTTNKVSITCLPCRAQCLTCFGPNINQCNSCSPSLPYYLNDKTCSASCLAGFGPTTRNTVCVKCKTECLTCLYNSSYCPQCKTTPANQKGFYMANEVSCYINCPNNYFQNYTTNSCQICHNNCSKCDIIETNCTACITGLYLLNFFCWNNCPNGYFNNISNCAKCNILCTICSINATFCSACNTTLLAYYSLNKCSLTCPNGTYNPLDGNFICKACHTKCSLCSNYPSPCYGCNPGYYLYGTQCYSTCPSWQLYGNNANGLCQDIYTGGVQLDIKMEFVDVTKQQVKVTMQFSEDINFTTFDYTRFQIISFENGFTSDQFTFTYAIISNRIYTIVIEPLHYIFLHNQTITVTTIPFTTLHYSTNNMPFALKNYGKYATLDWFLIVAPPMSSKQAQLTNYISNISSYINNFTSAPFIQDIKKLGIISWIFPGIQITSAMVHVNNVLPQNFYEGIRMMAVFVFIEVPPWQQDGSNKTNIFTKKSQDVLQKRMLTQEPEWRMKRTGFSTAFFIDNYIQMLSIVICWMILLIVRCCFKNTNPFHPAVGVSYTIFHRVHEISLMYLTTSTVMEWLYFDASQNIRWVSLIICIVFMTYFLIYQLYVYYDLHKYASTNIGTQTYNHFVIKYGSLLSSIRFEEYEDKSESGIIYSMKLWIRPYNYHLLSFYKKILMIASLPLFHTSPILQISVIACLQILEIVRLCLTRPYAKMWKNVGRFILELILLAIFIIILCQVLISWQLMRNQPSVEQTARIFYILGWLGFALVVLFNLSWMVIAVITMVLSLRTSNKASMDEIRKIYYFNKISSYEENNKDIEVSMVNEWIKKGNLNQKILDEDYQFVNPKIQSLEVYKKSNFFEIKCSRIVDLRIEKQSDLIIQVAQRLKIITKSQCYIQITSQKYPEIYQSLDFIYQFYKLQDNSLVKIKSYIKIELKNYVDGGKVIFAHKNLNQKIEIHVNGAKKIIKHDNLLKGIPLDRSLFF